MTALLEMRAVSKAFTLPTGERLPILTDLDLELDQGEVVAIVGRSGSGKSTLLNLLGLLDQPSAGRYVCAGTDIATLTDSRAASLRGSMFGFIFQQFHLLDRRTALENVSEPLLYAERGERKDRKRRAAELLEMVGIADRMRSMPHVLSGGEQQRVAIARALARRPRVVLADEPTGALDESTGKIVLDLLLGLARSEGVTLILVTHDQAISQRADRVLALANGNFSVQPS